MTALIVVPARHASSRFPGKPLAKIAGVAMLERTVAVARAAAAAADCEVLVATDHEEIAAFARGIGVRVVLTDPDLPSGSDRALAAVQSVGADVDFILNLQGDAPFTPVSHLQAVLEAGAGGVWQVATPAVRLSWDALDALRLQKADTPFSGTTCLRGEDGRALWFSKQILPAIRNEAARRTADPMSPVLQHVGLYGYRRAALERYCATPAGVYEALEGLEQLRFLENGVDIGIVEVEAPALAVSGIDTPEDLARAETLIARYGDPHAALSGR